MTTDEFERIAEAVDAHLNGKVKAIEARDRKSRATAFAIAAVRDLVVATLTDTGHKALARHVSGEIDRRVDWLADR